MYKCITEETPPDAIDRVIDDHLKKISEFGITIPPKVESVIIKGMSVSAKDRYQDIKDFCEDLYGGYEEIPASENEEIEIEQVLIKENIENKVKKKTSVQEVKSKTDNKKYRQQKKLSGKAVLAVILCILLVGGGVKLYSDKREQQIAEQKKQQYTLHNPKIEDDSSAKSGKKVTWDCLWFGSYPQSQITKKDGEIYTTLKNADNWDKNGDVTINNIKYHKTEAGYFKYEPIKWRVLQSENGEAFLLSDVILDKQAYNENDEYITWKESSLRAWLNDKFMNRAFSDEEKEKVNITEVVNKDNPVFGTKGGKNTSDKIFLLSLAEVSGKKDGKKYGLLDDEMKACENSDFSKNGSWWWLRSPGDDRYCAAVVNSDGWVYGDGSRVNGSDDGVRPALHLNLSFSNLFSYAGTVSSDGTKNEVPYNTRTRLIQQ